jgi:hypothetical protein
MPIPTSKSRRATRHSTALGSEPIYLRALTTHIASPAPYPAPVHRDWMDSSRDRFANRCLPLLLGNQAGWLIPTTCTARVNWSGGRSQDSLSVATDDANSPVYPFSHFGHGVLTWSIPYLFQTPPGYNLLVRGPSNYSKDGVQALDAIVETDWFPATFTMNWIMTRPYHTVTFKHGEPICMLVPQRRGELDNVSPTIGRLTDDPALERRYGRWHQSRSAFISALRRGEREAVKKGWQRDYFLGRDIDGNDAPEHQMHLNLSDFQGESEMHETMA